MFDYKVKITRVVDGDTVDADVDLGFDIVYRERIRLAGIDTPESRTRNKKEKALGLASKARLKALISENKGNIVLETTKDGKGKFGRILGTLKTYDTGISFNHLLMQEGHARPYQGGSKNEMGPWTKEVDGNWFRWTPSGYVEY